MKISGVGAEHKHGKQFSADIDDAAGVLAITALLADENVKVIISVTCTPPISGL